MSAIHTYPAGAGNIVLGDNTDDPSIQTVDLNIDIPLAGIHLHGPEYSVEIDGVWQGNAVLDLDYGPAAYPRQTTYESFIVPVGASTFELDWPNTGSSGLGGAQTIIFNLIQTMKPFVWIKAFGTWRRAIPWVYYSGGYQRTTPFVLSSSEWKELAQ